jgi:benzoyl-CoA reductase/2-hydroxyglutaryl-CoA dehydratase subunit BcrC/BadD/HgdB
LLVPSEICAALGISPLMIESLGGILGSLGMTNRFLHTVSQAGLPESLCTFHKMHLAFALEGGFSAPRFTLAASALCDGNLRALQLFTDLTDSDFYFFDFPHPNQEGAVEYLAKQFEDSYTKMASSMGIKNPIDRLKKAVGLSEEARKWLAAISERRKTHHFPLTNELIWSIAVISTSMGTKKAVALFRSLYKELCKKGKPIPPDTKRLLLIHLLPVYNHPVFERVFKKNVIISIEEYLYTDWPELDPENPFESIAARLLSWSVMAPVQERVNHLNTLIDEYEIDGVISSSHWGCRQADGPIHALQAGLKKPFLRIETDLVDSNSASTGQLSTRLEGFLEMIEAQ